MRSEDQKQRRRSLELLAAAYWKPVYKYLRLKWRRDPEEAKDLTQAFFAGALERALFERYDARRARFRTFVRACVDSMVADEDKSRRRLKRGGGAEHAAVDFAQAEEELGRAGVDGNGDPEAAFDREWRRSLFALAVDALRAESAACGRAVAFAVFEAYDLADEDERPSYRDLARRHGVPETTVTNHLATMRRELRRHLRDRLRDVTATDRELREETGLLLEGRSSRR